MHWRVAKFDGVGETNIENNTDSNDDVDDRQQQIMSVMTRDDGEYCIYNDDDDDDLQVQYPNRTVSLSKLESIQYCNLNPCT